jgi:hypothetical protein
MGERTRRADTGLYAAREGGRDRVVAGPPQSRRPAREASHRKAKMRQDTDDGKQPGDTGKRGSGWPTSR